MLAHSFIGLVHGHLAQFLTESVCGEAEHHSWGEQVKLLS